MRIVNSQVALRADALRVERRTERESLETWVGTRPAPQGAERDAAADLANLPAGLLAGLQAGGALDAMQRQGPNSLGDLANRLQALAPRAPEGPGLLGGGRVERLKERDPLEGLSARERMELALLGQALERLLGRPWTWHLLDPQDLELDPKAQKALDELGEVVGRLEAQGQGGGGQGLQGWGVRYEREVTRYEAESLSFQASAQVTTADGKTLAVDLSLHMSREFYQHEKVQVNLGDAKLKDPLVLHMDAPASQLGPGKVRFDLDVDGVEDEVAELAAGSYFVAMDRDGDGAISGGAELFGAQSGDGFADLALLDDDGNGWVDEGDVAWGKLRLWKPGAEGDRLIGLGMAGVGALFTGKVAGAYQFKDGAGELQGQVRSSGLALAEDGRALSLQQIDLAV